MATPLAISMGEPAGVGPDLILALHARRDEFELPPFAVYGHPGFLASRAARLGLSTAFALVEPHEAVDAFARALPVVPIEGLVSDSPGDPSPLAAKVVIGAIEKATADVLRGAARALVTAPIHKGVLYQTGFEFPGHTEFLAALSAHVGHPRLPVMMLAHEDLRVVPTTIHVPLSEVPTVLTPELLLTTIRIVDHDLRTRFGIESPRLAVSGLNPHAGEGGTIGREDVDLIGPTVARAVSEGIGVSGPIPADTLFYLPNWRRYDAVIAMYHDQALIPIKTVAFEDAVNVTLGLPLVRTSPDHGTAFDLAGTGQASPRSLLAAIRLAARLTPGT